MATAKVTEYWDGSFPEVCPTCGQKVDGRDLRQIEHHRQERHSLWMGTRR